MPNKQENQIRVSGKGTHNKSPPKREKLKVLAKAEVQQLVLYILRHGEAGSRMTDPGKDLNRALTSKGRVEMQEIAESLKKLGLEAGRVATSPLRRARETAEIVVNMLKIPLLEEWEDLKPDGDRQLLYRKLAGIEKRSEVMVVGHEPYLTSMIGEIIGAPSARLIVKKGGLAKVRVTSFSPRIQGELRWLLTPKLMNRMS